MAINTGVNATKVNAYAVLTANKGVNVTRLQAYAIFNQFKGVNASKVNAYAVLNTTNVTPPSWGVLSFYTGYVAVPYSVTWDIPSAASPITYSVTSGSLPPGLSITPLTGNQAKISGTPTTAGTYSFTLTAANTYGTASTSTSITINPKQGGNYGFIY